MLGLNPLDYEVFEHFWYKWQAEANCAWIASKSPSGDHYEIYKALVLMTASDVLKMLADDNEDLFRLLTSYAKLADTYVAIGARPAVRFGMDW